MKISGSEAIALIDKWGQESPNMEGLFEVFPQGSATLVLQGSVGMVSPVMLLVFKDKSFELGIMLPGAEFEYRDSREAPLGAGEWAESLDGILTITTSLWRCTLFESKSE